MFKGICHNADIRYYISSCWLRVDDSYFMPQPYFYCDIFVTNFDFLIPISLQPNFVDLSYVKFWLHLDKII